MLEILTDIRTYGVISMILFGISILVLMWYRWYTHPKWEPALPDYSRSTHTYLKYVLIPVFQVVGWSPRILPTKPKTKIVILELWCKGERILIPFANDEQENLRINVYKGNYTVTDIRRWIESKLWYIDGNIETVVDPYDQPLEWEDNVNIAFRDLAGNLVFLQLPDQSVIDKLRN